MATRIAEKAQRTFEFLVGLGDWRARRALASYGFTDAELDEGWSRLIALSKVPKHVGPLPARERLADLDAWENHWFPIIDVVLRTNHLPVHELVFLNLHQTQGVEVLVSVRLILDRLEAIARPEDEGGMGEPGRRAREHLARRGLNDQAIAHARKLLARVHELPPDDEPVADPEVRAAAEEHMWAWYLEWSGIARAAIKDRNVLNALGFRRPGRKKQ